MLCRSEPGPVLVTDSSLRSLARQIVDARIKKTDLAARTPYQHPTFRHPDFDLALNLLHTHRRDSSPR